ncbi:2-oxoacid dehydrogenases acyltransferase-domain-containing protein [Lasiosphaeria ovina]|uniref:Dihydrolipoamide acetyltransferase component of pyruvate dehydrogenase complex n=1 Tax=Lasiosphaeria ovina TaxID=92902 RepID=A0AAE0TXS4_9PEZI|nr:2-oxoacid dehydrogenases acyltransferase-domain-containing protein [Lasiosphaeria ovina]
MFWHQSARAVRHQHQQWHLHGAALARRLVAPTTTRRPSPAARAFHTARILMAVKPVLLADIGEGIVECEIIQWFVEPGARVDEFSPLCEVQSDKASVEITSRFAGIVKKLHYDAGEMAKVGKPFVDIDIEGSDAEKDALEALTPPEPGPPAKPSSPSATSVPAPTKSTPEFRPAAQGSGHPSGVPQALDGQKGKHATLATPAVRHLTRELGVELAQIDGTGRDGRVLKEDIYKFVEQRNSVAAPAAPLEATSGTAGPASPFLSPDVSAVGPQKETPLVMTRTQEMMFKTMTRSLSIPHFLYADEVDFTSLVELRQRLNRVIAKSGVDDSHVSKLSYLPFIIKAVSMAIYKYPILNARVDVDGPNANGSGKPMLVLRSQHNIGVAMDTPSGLLVPVIKNVGSLNVLGIAAELGRLQSLAATGKLSPQDMVGGTITVSNIGSIGGTYLSPVVVEREVAILGIGRMRTVPAFSSAPGDEDRVVRRQVCNFSWSADHRVVDGATMARAADVVRSIVEEPDVMVMHLR